MFDWASSQPVWLQVVIGLAVFFVGLPVVFLAVASAISGLNEFVESFRSPALTKEQEDKFLREEEDRKRRATEEGLTPIHFILIGLATFFVILFLYRAVLA